MDHVVYRPTCLIFYFLVNTVLVLSMYTMRNQDVVDDDDERFILLYDSIISRVVASTLSSLTLEFIK
jgi:hypothetical protein